MKHKQRWAGAICCFVLFIVVCLFLATHMKGAFRAAGHPEIGLLFFILPGAVASFFSHRREVLKPLFGAMLAAPCSMLIMRLFFSPTRSFWQELAWLLSAVFWCALGHCVSYLSVACLNHSTEKSIKPSTRGLVRRSGVQILFHPCSKIGIAADMLLIDKNLRHGFYGFTCLLL